MRGRRFLRVLKVVAIVIVAFTVFGFVVTHLWNYLMPGLFGLRTHYVLAGRGIDGPGAAPLRGIPARPRRVRLAGRDEAPLGTDDARRAREIPRRHARPLRPPEHSGARAEPQSHCMSKRSRLLLVEPLVAPASCRRCFAPERENLARQRCRRYQKPLPLAIIHRHDEPVIQFKRGRSPPRERAEHCTRRRIEPGVATP